MYEQRERMGMATDLARRGRGAGRGRLADLPRRPARPRRRRDAQPGQAGLGPEAAPACGSACGSHENTPCWRSRPSGAGVAVRTPYGSVARPPGRARRPTSSRRCCAGCRRTRPGLRLRADDRAAHRGPARRDRLARAARASATAATSSTTSGSPPTTGSCGAATTRSTPTAAGSTPSTTSDRRPSRRWPSTSSPRFPQLDGPALHPRLGRRDRHLLALLGVLRHRARRPGGYAPGYTGLGVGATRFGARRDAGPAGGRADRAHGAGDGAQEAAAVPAGAGALGRDRATKWSLAPGRRERRPAEPVAADPGPAGSRLRLMKRTAAIPKVAEQRASERTDETPPVAVPRWLRSERQRSVLETTGPPAAALRRNHRWSKQRWRSSSDRRFGGGGRGGRGAERWGRGGGAGTAVGGGGGGVGGKGASGQTDPKRAIKTSPLYVVPRVVEERAPASVSKPPPVVAATEGSSSVSEGVER